MRTIRLACASVLERGWFLCGATFGAVCASLSDMKLWIIHFGTHMICIIMVLF